ncbi:MAG: ubiquinone biosynthesis regulatory protein kinase UbiB, partial [Paraburkholderia sp.]|nr:ubiquinone biosynthesis regulatory protein kinase UbiB [Paraburkholderia sp.]
MLLHRQEPGGLANDETIRQMLAEQRRTNRLLQGLLVFGVAVGVGMVAARVWLAFAYGG